jgi:guanosine-3',5'-bis(diphosphate) 3'-pyrophosphohydrolase
MTSKPEAIELWQRAASFAAAAHRGQERKDGVTPYIAHPFRVAMTVRQVFGIDDPIALAIALLHDVIEDTTTDYDDLAEQFGADVADGVATLTKDKRLPDPQREPAFYARIAAGSWRVRLVKLADGYDNVCDAQDEKRRRKSIGKARHAIEAAGDDPRLAGPIARLRELIEQFS